MLGETTKIGCWKRPKGGRGEREAGAKTTKGVGNVRAPAHLDVVRALRRLRTTAIWTVRSPWPVCLGHLPHTHLRMDDLSARVFHYRTKDPYPWRFLAASRP